MPCAIWFGHTILACNCEHFQQITVQFYNSRTFPPQTICNIWYIIIVQSISHSFSAYKRASWPYLAVQTDPVTTDNVISLNK